MSHVYFATEWQGSSGKWYCNDVEDLAHGSGLWWIPARILKMELTDFIIMLYNEYNARNFSFNGETLTWSWEKQADMRRYKNFINAAARKINYII